MSVPLFRVVSELGTLLQLVGIAIGILRVCLDVDIRLGILQVQIVVRYQFVTSHIRVFCYTLVGIARLQEVHCRCLALMIYSLIQPLHIAIEFPCVLLVLEQQFHTAIPHVGQAIGQPSRVPVARCARLARVVDVVYVAKQGKARVVGKSQTERLCQPSPVRTISRFGIGYPARVVLALELHIHHERQFVEHLLSCDIVVFG